MVYLATDKQTYADLSITETASNEQFLFSLFSKTETKEGKALMLNWLMYPLSDLEETGGYCLGCFARTSFE